MTTVRTSTIGEAGDIDAPIGSREWAIAIRGQILLEWNNKESIESHLMRLRDAFTRHQAWQALTDRRGRPFRSWEGFCQAAPPYGLGLPPKVFDAEAERRSLRAKAGQPSKDEQENSCITRISLGENTNREYILARLERDEYFDLLAQVKRGNVSAHAAAVQVGYRKQKTPFDQLCHWWTKADDEARQAFRSFIA